MPRGDRTGPAGMGPKSGRGAGYCAGHGMPGFASGIPGRGAGTNRYAGYAYGQEAGGFPGPGRGGRGNRNRFYRTGFFGPWRGLQACETPAGESPTAISREDKIQSLKDDLQGFTQAAERIRARLAELEKTP